MLEAKAFFALHGAADVDLAEVVVGVVDDDLADDLPFGEFALGDDAGDGFEVVVGHCGDAGDDDVGDVVGVLGEVCACGEDPLGDFAVFGAGALVDFGEVPGFVEVVLEPEGLFAFEGEVDEVVGGAGDVPGLEADAVLAVVGAEVDFVLGEVLHGLGGPAEGAVGELGEEFGGGDVVGHGDPLSAGALLVTLAHGGDRVCFGAGQGAAAERMRSFMRERTWPSWATARGSAAKFWEMEWACCGGQLPERARASSIWSQAPGEGHQNSRSISWMTMSWRSAKRASWARRRWS